MPKAISFHVIVEIPSLEDGKIGSIFIPQETIQKDYEGSEIGKIVDIGPCAFKGRRDNPDEAPWYAIGDEVYFPRYSGRKLSFANGKQYRILTDEGPTAKVLESDGPLAVKV